MKNVLAALLKTMVTVALFYLLFRKVDFHEFWATLRTARFNLLLLGFAVLCVGHYVCLFRWRLLMRPLMPVPSMAQLLKIYCIGLFFNLAFPTVVGGDVVKMYYAGKPSRQYAQSFSDVPRPRRGDAGHDDHRLLCHACAPREHSRGPGLAHRMGGIRGLPAR